MRLKARLYTSEAAPLWHTDGGLSASTRKGQKANSRVVGAAEPETSSGASGQRAVGLMSSSSTGQSGSDGFGRGRRGPLGKDVREGKGGQENEES